MISDLVILDSDLSSGGLVISDSDIVISESAPACAWNLGSDYFIAVYKMIFDGMVYTVKCQMLRYIIQCS